MIYLLVFSPRGNYIIRAQNKRLSNLEEYEVIGKHRAELIKKYNEAKNYPKKSIRAVFEND